MECSPHGKKALSSLSLTPYPTFIKELTERIDLLNENATSIVHLDCQQTEIIDSQGIPFTCFLLAKLNKKPTHSRLLPKQKDPFLPPFEPGLFISELSDTHSLLFNKF